MIVCSCNVLSDGAVKSCLRPGAADCPRTPAQVYDCLGCSPKCGQCARTIRAILHQAHADARSVTHAECAAPCGAACTLVKVAAYEERVAA